MKREFFAIILLFSMSAFGEKSIVELELEPTAGTASPNKGLVGIRLYTMPTWSFGLIWGTLPFYDYNDFGLAASYHFLGQTGPYIFSSHHALFSEHGAIWEICTGGGYQHRTLSKILLYAEAGIPFYVSGGNVWRHYSNGVAYNRVSYGDVVLFDIKAGLGIGFIFSL
jgi:hypothetical protein